MLCTGYATPGVQFLQSSRQVKTVEAPTNARSRRTRGGLLAAARTLIEERGFESVTMAHVAERAGVSRRAVYLHFASRTELLTALFEYVNEAEDLASSTRTVWEAPDAVAALDEWARHLARYHPRFIGLARATKHARWSDADAAAHWELVTRDWHAACHRLAARLDSERLLAPPWTVTTAADMLWALMSFDVLEGLLVDRGWSQQRYATHLAALFRATFAGAAEAAGA